MNRTQIEWCDYTWNPVTGCKHGCPYCYARRMAKRLAGRAGYPADDPFRPTFHPDRLEEPLKVKEPSVIFVCSMGDLFGAWVDLEWIDQVMQVIAKAHWHTFIVLTKDPRVMAEYALLRRWNRDTRTYLPDNLWVGSSIDRALSASRTRKVAYVRHHKKFVSIEPILGDVAGDPTFDLRGLQWVIVGAQTGPGAVPPKPHWVDRVVTKCMEAGVPFFIKDNVPWEGTRPQMGPEGMPEQPRRGLKPMPVHGTHAPKAGTEDTTKALSTSDPPPAGGAPDSAAGNVPPRVSPDARSLDDTGQQHRDTPPPADPPPPEEEPTDE